jgi:membrane fusion protein (multidrug efflux system)
MLKKLLITIFGLVAIVGGIALTFGLMIHHLVAASAAMTVPPTPVTTEVIKTAFWQPQLVSVGSLSAVQGVTLSAQLDGTVTKIHFEAGAKVKEGDVLLEMDVSAEQAQLRASEASLELARTNLKRSEELLEKNTISQAQLDTDRAAELQMAANADNIRALIAKKTVRAPFTGRLGVRLVNLGQTLKAGDQIVSLQALDPIFADFYLPQQEVSSLAVGLPINLTCDAFPGQAFAGKVTAISPEVDASTRNVRVQATLANADEKLRPGMFVGVQVELPSKDTVIPIPQTAVLYAPFGNSVYLVEDQKDEKSGQTIKVAKQHFVRLGRKQGDYVAVISGVKNGDLIVTSGVFKLRPGAPVVLSKNTAPDAQLAPKPNDS